MKTDFNKFLKFQIKRLYKIMQFFRKMAFRIRYPSVRYFDKVESKYSQHGQDEIVIQKFFLETKNGFFCDVGANHPFKINNTWAFEEMGWSGIAFDPQTQFVNEWKKRTNTVFFPTAVSSAQTYMSFRRVSDVTGWENTLSYLPLTQKDNFSLPEIEEKILVRKLQDFLDELGITKIDFFSMDVEGHEHEVLRGIDFQKVQIDIFLIENNPADKSILGDNKIRKFLKRKGYKFYGRIHESDDIFVNSRIIDVR